MGEVVHTMRKVGRANALHQSNAAAMASCSWEQFLSRNMLFIQSRKSTVQEAVEMVERSAGQARAKIRGTKIWKMVEMSNWGRQGE